jgi:hypothetical protein
VRPYLSTVVCPPLIPFLDNAEGDIGKQRRSHPSYNLAKLPFEPSVVIAREAIRSRYGDGFAGAPLKLNRLPADGRTTHRDADGAAHAGSTGTHGPGPVRSDPAEKLFVDVRR